MVANCLKPRSLTAQIKDAERQVSNRQRAVNVRAATLIKKIHQEITAPSTLLLAGGIGFIIGELTTQNRGADENPRTTGTSPLKIALNLMASAHTLYTALPIAWMIKYFHQPRASDRQAPEKQSRPMSAASGAAGNRR